MNSYQASKNNSKEKNRKRGTDFSSLISGGKTCLAVAALASLAACGGSNDPNVDTSTSTSATTSTTTPATPVAAVGVNDGALAFDKSNYTTISLIIDGVATPVRFYKEICYVAKPVLMASTQAGMGTSTTTIANPKCGYQSMNIYVPESTAADQESAIYFAPNNAGWMGGYIGSDGGAAVTAGASYASSTSQVGAAIKRGFIFASVATRGRGMVAADGSFQGKDPAVVVDAKAAIRYLKLNDAIMPGNANHIIVNSTSGGGGLAVVLGTSGNSTDYLPYLATIGAAGIAANGTSTLKDDVLAINAYCPITDLGNADVIYEWLFNILGTRATVNTNANPTGSATLLAKFSAYQAGLKIKNAAGVALTSDNMLDELRLELKKSAEAYMAAGNTIPARGGVFTLTTSSPSGSTTSTYPNDWITVDATSKMVLDIDLTRYLAFVATQSTLKPTPAFDRTGVTISGGGGESSLFGNSVETYTNFTEYSWMNNDVAGDGIGYADTGYTWSQYTGLTGNPVLNQLNLINPFYYLNTTSTKSPFWYVRHGTRDRDTASIVSINLARALSANSGIKDVNYGLAWGQPHAGNYDVPEAMAWIDKILVNAKALGI